MEPCGSAKKRKLLTLESTSNDLMSDFICPICFQVIDEPHVTKCGHTYCFKCISLALEQSNRCPECSKTVDAIFPNLLCKYCSSLTHSFTDAVCHLILLYFISNSTVNEVICKQRRAMIQQRIDASNNVSNLRLVLTNDATDTTLFSLN